MFLAFAVAVAGVGVDRADGDELRVLPATYPEGPLWQGDRLYFAEMRVDRITVSEASGASIFYAEDGCGPTAIASYGEGFLVLCHLGKYVVAVDASGRELRRWERDAGGNPLQDPNDASADGRGGVYFSDPGRFSRGSPAEGWVMYLGADGTLTRVAGPYRYPNGMHVADGELYVSEHLRRVVLRFPIEAAGRLGAPRVFADLNNLQAPERYAAPYALSGPDGLERGPDGCLYVAMYGEGRLLRFSMQGELLGMLDLAPQFLTNIAFGAEGVALAGSFDNRSGSSVGEVRVLSELPAELRAGTCATGA